MKAYLDLNTGIVVKDNFSKLLSERRTNKGKYFGLPINKQIYFFEFEDDVLVYAPYNRFAALIDEQEYEYLLTHPVSDNDIPRDLLYGYFYYRCNNNSPERLKKETFEPTDLTVFLGDSCNLSCVYCNATRARGGGEFDISNTLLAVRNILRKYPIKHISFFGNGEPLMYFDAIKKIVATAEKYGVKSFYVSTNGVFWDNTSKYVRFLVEHKIYTQLSIDGYEEIHDLHRPMSNSRGSFKYVLKTIKEFEKYGDINKYCFARFTLSEYSAGHLRDIILFLYKIGFRKIRFAELISEDRAQEQLNALMKPPNPLQIVDSIVEALLLADSLGIDITGDYDPRKPSEAGIFPCPYMGGKAIALNKNLQILSCLEDYDKWIIGYVNLKNGGNIIIDYKRLVELQRRNMLSFEECISCPVKCGGGCTHYSYLKHKKLSVPGDYKEKCGALRLILQKYLLAKLRGG